MMRVFVFRPEPGFAATIEAGKVAGLAMAGEPLSTIEPVDWQTPAAHDFDGLLVGSANVFRQGGSGLAALRKLPAYCVGDTTAEAAREAGFSVAQTGTGGLQNVLDSLTGQQLRLLRLCGQDRVKLNRTAKVGITECPVYTARFHPLGEDIAAKLSGNLVLLHSAATARHFAQQCDVHKLDMASITLITIGQRVAAAAGPGWRAVHSAARPDDASMLALAAQICRPA